MIGACPTTVPESQVSSIVERTPAVKCGPTRPHRPPIDHLLRPGSEQTERLPLGGVPETPKRPSRKPAATIHPGSVTVFVLYGKT